MSILVILLVAVSLSMDAFSLALAYGTLNLDKNIEKLISIVVGLFHLFMPVLGLLFGKIVLKIMPFDPDIISSLIFIGLGIEMLLSLKNEEDLKEIRSMLSVLLFGLAVSIDSFLVGINFGINETNVFLSSTIFMIVSFIFTYSGLKVGKKINNTLGNISIIIGGIILIILGLFYLN